MRLKAILPMCQRGNGAVYGIAGTGLLPASSDDWWSPIIVEESKKVPSLCRQTGIKTLTVMQLPWSMKMYRYTFMLKITTTPRTWGRGLCEYQDL